MKHCAVVTQPRSSSGLGGYLIEALRAAAVQVDVIDCLASRAHKLLPVLRSLSFDRETMWRRRWENQLFSSGAWRRNSAANGRLLARVRRPDTRVLQVAKEYFPFPEPPAGSYALFLLYNMRLSLGDGVTPWVPPPADRARFLALETELFRRASHIFVGGTYVKENLVAEYGVDPAQVTVAGGGVHPDYLAQRVAEVPAQVTNRLVFVGWDFGMKGGQTLLEAFALARAQRPELELLVAGPDAAQQTPQPGVTWLGPVRSRGELIELYRRCDLFVMPSLRDSFGFVFLEAMTQGLPCIGTRMNAMPEIIAEGESGWLVPPRDAPALAAAMLAFYRDSGARLRMGRAALARVQDRFTWARVAEPIRARLWEDADAG